MNKFENFPADNDYKEIITKIFNQKKEKQNIKSKKTDKTIDEIQKKWMINDNISDLFKDKIENDMKLKSTYAKILITILIVQLIVLNVIFILKGINVLNYSDNTLNLFITGGIAEIYVLVKIIVQYLFSDNLTELLKIILRANNNFYYKRYENKKNNQKEI